MDLKEIKQDLEVTEAKNLESNQNTFNQTGDDSQSFLLFPLFAKSSWPLSDRSDKIIPANYFNRRRKLFSVGLPVGSVENRFSML